MTTDRYLRQTLLPEIGQEGQRKLARSRILCVGAGGLGSPVALYLAAAGVGRIGIIDPDRVDLTNLQRQVLFCEEDVGRHKALLARDHLGALNSGIRVDARVVRLCASNVLEALSEYDIVVEGTDNFAAKFLLNDAAARLGKPVVYGSISRMEGQVSVFWAAKGPCYRCLYPEPPKAWVPNCAESGVLGAVAGVIGSMQAIEAIKLALGLPALVGQLLVWDALKMRARTIALARRPDCPVCSRPAESIELQDLPDACVVSTAGVRELSAGELEDLLKRGEVRLVDVREIDEWREGRLPGAHHFPLSRLQQGERPEVPSSTLTVLYCQSGTRSRQALELLLQEDATRTQWLAHLKGGFCSLNSGKSSLSASA